MAVPCNEEPFVGYVLTVSGSVSDMLSISWAGSGLMSVSVAGCSTSMLPSAGVWSFFFFCHWLALPFLCSA